MKKTYHALILASIVMGVAGAGCSPLTPTEKGSWVPETRGPWDSTIYSTTSDDGLTFTGKTLVIENAGVPNLLRLTNGDLVLTYQYFSMTAQDMFDLIAYSVSDDDGKTWSAPKAIEFSGLPESLGGNKIPMDPTLVQQDDGSLRLYFTYHKEGTRNAALYSAATTSDDVSSAFIVEPEAALSLTNEHLLDPAMVYFDGLWHHYTGRIQNDKNMHSTSTDGVAFTRQEDIKLPMDFLGQVIPADGGLRFYGTNDAGVVSAFSTDGSTWTMESGTRAPGVDPGIQQLADGSYLMIYTGLNFNE